MWWNNNRYADRDLSHLSLKELKQNLKTIDKFWREAIDEKNENEMAYYRQAWEETITELERKEEIRKELKKQPLTPEQQATLKRKNWLTKAVKTFGITDNPFLAGYIIPSGKMLNFGGPYHREFDHRQIGMATGEGGYEGMNRFIHDTNSIRFGLNRSGDTLFIHIGKPLTSSQFRQLQNVILKYPLSAIGLDITDEEGSNIFNEFYNIQSSMDKGKVLRILKNSAQLIEEQNSKNQF